ncbi:acyl carrier protein [Oceanospirillum sediminis]|uniref:Acyl carrier protein n=1 Tax=Oceanospirillum sediminis TaxID=2760088 RepID=A0A839IMW7_9GAMM|nr:acyl carrier protein [Oceanospirillum sediminis]MBB1485636.1 acyl carrier protein [Oceanospirillum sediminis]
MNTLDWLKNKVNPEDKLIDLNANYFDQGLIDSFDIIMLIEDVEEEFGITLDEENFQDRRFSCISGLAEIINERLSFEK